MSDSRRGRRSYHHGDLRRALLEAGLALVAEQGENALSLRAVARRARVSHAAPYHHFKSKAELLAAVAAAGFDRLVAAIENEVAADQPRTPLDQLRAVGRGYVRFAARQPMVFRLMFRPELTRPAAHLALLEAEARAYGFLHHTIVAAQEAGQLRGKDPRPYAAFAWSSVHGLALLHVDQVLHETPIGRVPLEDLLEHVNEMCLAGLANAKRPR